MTMKIVDPLAEMLRDAKRYRLLRKQHWWDSPLAVVVNPKAAIKLGCDCPSLDRLDSIVDAMLQDEDPLSR